MAEDRYTIMNPRPRRGQSVGRHLTHCPDLVNRILLPLSLCVLVADLLYCGTGIVSRIFSNTPSAAEAAPSWAKLLARRRWAQIAEARSFTSSGTA